MIWIAILIAIYLAWSVGVNTLGATLGMVVGGGILRFNKAMVISSIFVVIGVAFLSKGIVKTLGSELVNLGSAGLISVLITMGILVTFLSWRGLPVSIGYVVIGSLSGYSVINGAYLNYTLFAEILTAFLSSPIAALIAAFLMYKGIKKYGIAKLNGIKKIENFEKKFYIPTIFGFILLSLVLGANSLGIVVGILGNVYQHNTLVLIGSFGFILGVTTWSYKIAKTIGQKVTDLSPSRTFTAQLATGAVAMSFISFGIPVSLSQTMIGAILGIGLARKKLEKVIVKRMLISWAFVLPASFVLAGFIGWLL